MGRSARLLCLVLAILLALPSVAFGYSTGPATVVDDVEGAGFTFSGPRDSDNDNNTAFHGMNTLWYGDGMGGWPWGSYRHWSYIQRSSGTAYCAYHRYTHTFANYYLNGVWRPKLPYTAKYDVYAWIPWNTTTHADYRIEAADGQHTTVIKQFGETVTTPRQEWVHLGKFPFNEGTAGSVSLDNASPESAWALSDYLVYYNGQNNARCQVWDAVKLVPINGEILVRVFHDRDHDGVRDETDEWLPGRRVVVDGSALKQTDAEGRALYEGVTPEPHNVSADLGAGEFATTRTKRRIRVNSEETAVMDVGIAHFGSAEGVKYLDANGDGVRQADETTRLAGWMFRLRPQTDGLRAQFFDNLGSAASPVLPSQSVYERIDSRIAFDWGYDGPSDAVSGEDFGVRWEGYLSAPTTGTYTIVPGSDDGLRLWLDGRLLVDEWIDRGYTENPVTVQFEGGKSYPIKIEMYENGGTAAAFLKWKRPGDTAATIVPAANLSPMQETVTDATGCFVFDRLLPGVRYTVEEMPPTLPVWEGWQLTAPASGGYEVAAAEGLGRSGHAVAQPLEFLNAGGGHSVVGMKFEDRNDDGVYQGPGETEGVVAGWKVWLYDERGELVTSDASGRALTNPTITNAEGVFAFEKVKPGRYTVVEEDRDGWLHSTPERLAVDVSQTDALLSFGNVRSSDVHVSKFHDRDCDGTWDVGAEEALPDWPVRLKSRAGAYDERKRTGADGASAEFLGVRPGAYEVSEEILPGWSATTTSPIELDVRSGETTGVAFGNVQLGAISGVKYHDRDADGVRDAGADEGLERWEIVLTGTDVRGAPVERRTFTSADGSYTFGDLLPGKYSLTEVNAEGDWRATEQPEPIELEAGERATGQDFGNVQLGSIAVAAWDDSDADGSWDATEKPLPGWSFRVTGTTVDGRSFDETLAAGENGKATLASLLPGTYRVEEESRGLVLDAEGRVQRHEWLPVSESARTVVLAEGADELLEFGNIETGCVWGRVTHQVWGNGVAGLPIVIEETGETVVTDENGYYYFRKLTPNGTALVPTKDYLLGMELGGTAWKTDDAVDKAVVIGEGTCERVDFRVWDPTTGNQPRTIGYWKNWRNHYSEAEMGLLLTQVRGASAEFAGLTIADVETVLKLSKTTTMKDKARAQYLAVWLNMASGNLGLATVADLRSVSDWQQVVSDDDGRIQMVHLVEQVEAWFARADVLDRAWETVKNILDALNNRLLT